MTREASPKLLVVSGSDDREELTGVLRAGGFDDLHAADGGDDTLSRVQALDPDVVVLCADIGHGEVRALASAIRRDERRARLVLVGQRNGPVKNALDAAAYDIDHFVGRPLSAKALAFAVGTGVSGAARAHRGGAPAAADGGAAGGAEDGAEHAGSAPSAGGDEMPGEPIARAPGDPIARATDVAIDAVVREGIASLPPEHDHAQEGAARAHGEVGAAISHPDAVGAADERAEGATGAGDSEAFVTEAGAEDPGVDTSPGHAASSRGRLRGRFAESTAADRADPEAPAQADAELPVAPQREPTLVLPDDAGHDARDSEGWAEAPAPARVADTDAAPAAPAAEAAETAPHRIGLAELAALDAAAATRDAERVRAPSAEMRALGDAGAGFSDQEDREREPAGEEEGFAGELRRKMSQMAQRLFPTDEGPPVDLGLAHSAHTEIDLAGLGVDTLVWDRDDPNLIGGELPPAPPFEDTETRERYAGTGEVADTRAGAADTTEGKALPARGEIGPAGSDVATILAERYLGGFTGHLVFRRGEEEKRVHFVEGRPVFAASNLPHDRMGELLCREGKITREQLDRCWQAVVESGRRMGEVLVELGCLKRRELLPAVRRHVEDIIYSIFAWEEGEHVAIPEDVASGETIRLSRHPAAIILEGVRRKYARPALERHLGTPEAVVVVSSRKRMDEILASADLSHAERAFVQALDGDRDLGQLAREKDVELLLAYQLAFGLIALGVAQLLYKGGEDDADGDVEAARAPSLIGETDLAIDRQRVLAKRALVDEADYFSLLGVRRDATRFEIRRAYESARREYAPGSFPAEVRSELEAEIDEIIQLLDEAFYVLDDDDLRAAYLANLRD